MKGGGRAWIRNTTTLIIIGFLLAVTIIGYQRTRRSSSGVGSVDADAVGLSATDVAVGLYRGFRHTETAAGLPVFVLDSLRTLSFASGWQEIEGVRLQLYDKAGQEGPVLTAERASFNVDTKEARIEGAIHVEFPNGAFLNTDAGRYKSRSQTFTTEAPVLYVDGPTFGQAERASYDLADNRIKLEGNAAFRTDDGMLMVAPRVVYRRDESRVIFSHGVTLTQGLSRLDADRAEVELSKGDGPPQAMEFTGGVSSSTVVESTGALVEMWSERVRSERDARGNWQVRARTSGRWIEVRFIGGPDYYERTLRTLDMGAVVGGEGLVSLRAEDGVCLEEIPIEGPPRSAEAETARAWFNAGQVTDVEMDEQVKIRAAGVTATGQRARLVQSTGIVMLQRDPTGRHRVTLDSEKGRITCDEGTLYDREDRVEARGQVTGELRETGLFGSETEGEDAEPVRFAGEILQVTEDGDMYALRDNARVWQGQRLLLADDIEYRHETESVTALGHVRATFPANQMDPDASEEEDVIVTSRSLDYDADRGRAVFRGLVRYSDPKHSLAANRLTVDFDETNSISDVEAEGAVEINDLETGRRLTGQHAIREVSTQVITVTGSPAQLTDERGNVASGESLTWNQADGTVSIGGGTELIYYPEEQP
jgi:lipopolysaccharide export system protein LptA